jgi:nitrate/nitrite transporter NarK
MCALPILDAADRNTFGRRRRAGIAWINSIGNLSGYASPYLIGTIKDRTHSMTLALLALSACQLIGSALTLYVTRNRSSAQCVKAQKVVYCT